MIDLSGKRILITGGGGTGVGRGVCQVLEKYGCHLVINEVNEDRAQLAQERYPDAVVVVANVAQAHEVEAMWIKISEFVGTVDGVVNNAGVGLTQKFWDIDEEEFQRIYQTNIAGIWRVCRGFVKHLLAQNHQGHIVNISSIHASATAPNYAIYSSAKSAVESLTRGMAVELGPLGLRVNAVAPGYVHAEQNFDLIRSWTDDPEKWVEEHTQDHQVLRHLIDPEDCGQAVAFLLSDLSRSTTGHTLHVDNGMTLQLYNNKFMN